MLLSAIAIAAVAPTAVEAKLLRFPAVYGDKIAFVYGADIWIADKDHGFARRLTTHPGNEAFPRFSPDGKWIAFTGQYDMPSNQVYVVSVDGGSPTRLTSEGANCNVTGWTPDGKVTYASNAGSPFTAKMWTVSTDGGMPKASPIAEYANGTLSPDGKTVAYNRNNSYNFNWRRYRGGTQGRISFYDLSQNKYWEAPSGRENSYWPMWAGDTVYYVSDKTAGTINLWAYNPASKASRQLTQFTDGDIKNPSTDGRTIVFERDGGLYEYDIAKGATAPLGTMIGSDLLATRSKFRSFAGDIEDFDLSPSGKRVAVVARGEVFSLPASSGETRTLNSATASREKSVAWSADGQTVRFLSDRSGDWKIYSVPQMGGEAKLVPTPAGHKIADFGEVPGGKSLWYTTPGSDLYLFDLASSTSKLVYSNPGSGNAFDISQDGKWVVYSQLQPNLFSAVYLYEVGTGKATKITEGYYDDGAVAFDMNGKYLYLVSSRTYGVNIGAFEIGLHQDNVQRAYVVLLSKDQGDPLRAEPDEEPLTKPEGDKPDAEAKPGTETKVDLDGISDRMLPLPWANGHFGGLIGLTNGVLAFYNDQMVKYDMGSRSASTILSTPGAQLAFNAKRTKMAYYAGGTLGIVDVRPDVQIGQGRVPTGELAYLWNPREEWAQMYWEAWRHERDNFYDEGMLGLDWKAIGDKYAALLPHVSHRNDLNYLIGLMIGELGTGHAYIQGAGDTGYSPSGGTVGMLGCDYATEGNYVKFAKIYRGLNFEPERRGPLGAPGVQVSEGDYLLAVDGKDITPSSGVGGALMGKANRTVTLTVNDKPSKTGARSVTVQTIANEGSLRYISWVEGNRKKVAEASQGRIGYMHVPNTNFQGIIEFMKGFYSNSGAEAWIIDERYNGGGFIPTFFIEALQRQMQTAFSPRYGADVPLPDRSLEGPKCMLINEFAGSGGDMFPWLFKRNKLGKLIGTRTWGGLVGIQGAVNFVDGGGVTAPAFGIYDRDTRKWIAENTGVDPDIEVDARPDLIAQGKDPVLERAIQEMTAAIGPTPRKPVEKPLFPTIKK